MKKVVVLFSGGLDSTTCAAIAKGMDCEVYLMTVAYGQRHQIEVQQAVAVAKEMGLTANHRVVNLPLNYLEKSALTNHALELPTDRTREQMLESTPITYVPWRNALFLSLAASWAEDLGADEVWFGVSEPEGRTPYPDCSEQFVKAMNDLGNVYATGGHRVRFIAPLLNDSKKEVVRKGLAYNAPYHLTWTCYKPVQFSDKISLDGKHLIDPQTKPCGHCDSCVLRAKGFEANGVKDPAVS